MLNKKIMMLTFILTCILVISAVSAAENVSEDVNLKETADDAISIDEKNVNNDINDMNYNELNNQNSDEISNDVEILSSVDDADVVSFENDNDITVKSSSVYPSYSDYTVKLYDCYCDFGTSPNVEFRITPSNSHTYKYYFYLKIYDSNNKEKYSKVMYSKEITSVRAIYMNSIKDWNPGTYTMKIINYYDNKVMSTAKLIINKNSDKVTYNSPTKSTVGSVVKKTTPKLITKSKTFKKSVKTKKYTITLKTNKNKAMKKMNVYLKVKGKTYKATTNSKGKATFKIKNLKKKGTFKAKVKYVGNAYYNAVTKTVKIKVK